MSKAKTMAKTVAQHAMPAGGSMEIPLGLIIADPEFNVRKSKGGSTKEIEALAATMDKEGQIQDVLVEPTGDGKYQLRVGFRRFAAAGILKWDTIRASLWEPTGDKGEPIADDKDRDLARYFVNMAENVAREDLSTFDLAMRCKLVKRKYGVKGGDIAKRLGKTTGYINTLLQIVGEGEKGEHAGAELAAPILGRWREECSWDKEDRRTKVCFLNQLTNWIRMPKEEQLVKFNETLYHATGGKEGAKPIESAADAGAGGNGSPVATSERQRATMGQIEKALTVAKWVKDNTKGKEQITRMNGIIDALEFALGAKRGKSNRLKDVCVFDAEGKMTECAMPEPKEDKKKESKKASKGVEATAN